MGQCMKHLKKEWMGSEYNCPYCEISMLKENLVYAKSEINILGAQVRLFIKAAKEGEQVRKDVEEGKY